MHFNSMVVEYNKKKLLFVVNPKSGRQGKVVIPLDAQQAISAINRFETKYIDYGKINGIPFFCTCGIGFDALISSLFSNSKERGPLGYVEMFSRVLLTIVLKFMR